MTLKAFSVYRRIWKGSKGSDLDAVMNFEIYLTGRGKLLLTTTKGEKHKTKMTKLQKQK